MSNSTQIVEILLLHEILPLMERNLESTLIEEKKSVEKTFARTL